MNRKPADCPRPRGARKAESRRHIWARLTLPALLLLPCLLRAQLPAPGTPWPHAFDPRVLRPSDDIVTPHVPWFSPSAGKPLSILFVVAQSRFREVVEIGQRLDADIDVYPVADNRGGFNTPPLTEEDFRRSLIAKLDAKPDLLVVAVPRWDLLALWERYYILKHTKSGTPLLTLESAADTYLKQATRETTPARLDCLVPYALLPAFAEAATWDDVVADHLTVSPFGQSRIVQIKGISSAPPQILTPRRSDDALVPKTGEYEGYMLWLIQVLRMAAGQQPSCRLLPETACELDAQRGGNVDIRLETPGPQTVAVQFRLRTPWDEQVLEQKKNVTFTRREIETVSFEVAGLPAGDYFADVRVLDGERVVDAGCRAVIVRSTVSLGDLTVPTAVRRDETIAGTIALSGLPAGTPADLRMTITDNYGRVTRRHVQPVPANAGTDPIPFTLAPSDYLTILQRLDIDLAVEGQTVDRKRAWFSVRDLYPDTDDVRYVIWGIGGAGRADSYLSTQAFGALADVGFDTQYTSFTPAAISANMRHIPYAVRLQPSDEKRGPDQDPHVRRPCLTASDYREELAGRLTNRAEAVEPFSVNEFSMGDECHFRWRDQNELCFSETCTAAFHTFLRNEYKTVEALNSEYETTFKSFAEVKPVTLKQAREDADLAPQWVDFRRHMDSNWADIQEFCEQTLRKVVPGARTGYEGTDYDNYSSLDAFNLAKIMRAMTLNNTYDGAFAPYAVVDLAQPGSLIGTGWMGSYADYKKYNDWDSQAYNAYIPWRHLFRGANSFWVWYACINDRGMGHGSITAPDFSVFECFRPNTESMHVIKNGVGALFMHARRAHDGTAFVYSQDSLHAATLAGMDRIYGDTLRSMIPLMEDTQQQFRVVSAPQLRADTLRETGVRTIFLPFAQAISVETAEQIRDIVRNGGTLIADIRPAVCDQHGKPYSENGILDDVFGIRQNTQLTKLEKHPVQCTLPGTPENLPDCVSDAELALAGAVAHGRAGNAPAFLEHTFGNGRAYLWNISLEGYQRKAGVLDIEVEKLQPAAPQIRDLFRALVTQAGIESPVRLEPPVPSVRTYRFEQGGNVYLGVLQHPLRAKAQAEATPPPAVPMSIHVGRETTVYDVRQGTWLGRTDTIRLDLGPGEAKVYALLPYGVTGLTVDTPAAAQRGTSVPISVKLTTDAKPPELHVVRMRVTTPGGRPAKHYDDNIIAEKGAATIQLPLALNDPTGLWRLQFTEVATGVTAEAQIQIKE